MDYNVYSTDGTFPSQYGYLRIRYGANNEEYAAVYHDQIENILYTNLWRAGENKWSGWKRIITNNDLPIMETFIPTFNNTDTVAVTLQHKVIDGGHIFVTNGDFVACPVPIVGIRLPDGDRTNKVEVRFASNIVGVARINILYEPYYS